MFKRSNGFKKIREDYQRERWRYATETFDLEEADPEDIREFDLDEGWGDNDLPVMTGRDHPDTYKHDRAIGDRDETFDLRNLPNR